MTRSDYSADLEGPDHIGDIPAEPTRVDLASFLPLSVKNSLVGLPQVVDANGATFCDRAYQMRGFALRDDFKDEWKDLAPQLVEAVNGYGPAKAAARDALEALREVSGVKMPVKSRKALARALEALARVARR